MEPADAVLLERWVGRRDAEAFQALVKRYSAMVFSACRRVLGDAGRAEDVTQECFLKLAMGDARPGPFLGPWLHRMATRRCLDAMRTERRRRAREARYVAEGPRAAEVRWEALEPLIDEALAELPERYRVPVTLHFLEGLSHEEVAQRLDTPRRTVSYRITQGLERMGARLRARGVNVASGVLVAQLGDMPVVAPPAELVTRLSKMALARAARVLPHAPWWGASPVAYAVSAMVVLAVAVVGWVGTNRPRPDRQIAPVFAAAQGEKAAEAGISREAVHGAVSETPLSVPAQDASVAVVAASVESAPEPCSISGSVVDEARVPIPNATVLALRADSIYVVNPNTPVLSARTDAQGLFRIAGIPSKLNFLLVAGAEGYDTPLTVTSYLLEPGKSMEDQCIVLSKGVTLSGRVLGRDGAPVADALVMRTSFQSDTSSGGGKVCAQTDAKGTFQLGFPGEGTTVLQVMTQQWGNAVFEVGVQEGAPVELRMPASARVAGRVTRADGTPANDMRVVFRAVGGDGRDVGHFEAFTLVEGLYQIDSLPPDLAYEVLVVDKSSHALSRTDSLGVLAAGSQTKHDFRLEAPGRVRGTVTGVQTGRPQKGAHIGWVFNGKKEGSSITTGEDGRYEVEFFDPGSYLLFPIPASGEWGEDFPQAYGRSVTVALGKEQSVDFRLPDAFSLGVRVVDGQGKAIPNATVKAYCSPEADAITSFAYGQTDGEGRYRFEGCRPECENWLTVELPEQNPSQGGGAYAVQRVESTHVRGAAGVDYPEETVVTYEQSGLSGVALGPDGKALADCRIAVHMEAPGIVVDGARVGAVAKVVYVESDASGAFAVSQDVPATRLELWVSAMGADGGRFSVDVGSVECLPNEAVELGALTFAADANTGEARERISVPVVEGGE